MSGKRVSLEEAQTLSLESESESATAIPPMWGESVLPKDWRGKMPLL